MLQPHPRQVRHAVVRKAFDREDGLTLPQVAKEFGIHSMAYVHVDDQD